MDKSTVTRQFTWTSDQRRDTARDMYLELVDAQKYICQRDCGSQHAPVCDRINAVLLDAEPVLQEWSEE